MPTYCPNVPSKILNPKLTWENKDDYDAKAQFLAKKFNENFKKYEEFANKEIMNAMPKLIAEMQS
jgi:phosphoenolpyruvate carboxykinase (ATP)